MQFDQLNRREFITLLGGMVVTWPLAAGAQQPALPVIGYVSGASMNRLSKWKAGSTRNVHKFAPIGHTQNGFALAKAA